MIKLVLMLCVSIVVLIVAPIEPVIGKFTPAALSGILAWISVILCVGFLEMLYAQNRTRKNMEKMINLLDTIAKQNKKD